MPSAACLLCRHQGGRRAHPLPSLFRLLAGIGLNLSNPAPTTCVNAVLRRALGLPAPPPPAPGVAPVAVPVSREAALATILGRFEELHSVFRVHGFGPLKHSYLKHWLHTGQRLRVGAGVSSADGRALAGAPGGAASAAAPGSVEVEVLGLADSGYLLAREVSGGAEVELHPDGNSLDFFAGLLLVKKAA